PQRHRLRAAERAAPGPRLQGLAGGRGAAAGRPADQSRRVRHLPPHPMSQPALPVTPPESIRGIRRETVFVKDRAFLIERPDESDRMLDHPRVKSELLDRDFMPYWTDLWPAARMLAKWAVEREWPAGLHALEIGCGLGLAGVAALSRGVRVTFSDYDATALQFAARNARLNGFTDFDTLQMDWNHPPEGMKFRVILASDLVYE